MGNACARIALVFFVLAASFATGQTFPEHHDGLVNDLANKLSAGDRQKLEAELVAYEKRTTNEIAFVTVPSLNGISVEEYANKLFRAWGIGKKEKKNGILFLWATTEKKVRIEVGYGLEPDLPDGRAGQIIRDDILPKFRNQEWSEGVFGGVHSIIAQLDSKSLPPPAAERVAETEKGRDYTWIWIIVILGIGVLLIIEFVTEYRGSQTDVSPSTSRRIGERSEGNYVPIVVLVSEPEPSYRSRDDSPSSSSSSSSSDSDGGSSFGGGGGFDFGGGDSGGGGASGSY